MIATFFKEGIVCMESALFYYGYSDKTPLEWTIAVPRTITRTKTISTVTLLSNSVNEYINKPPFKTKLSTYLDFSSLLKNSS